MRKKGYIEITKQVVYISEDKQVLVMYYWRLQTSMSEKGKPTMRASINLCSVEETLDLREFNNYKRPNCQEILILHLGFSL